MIGSHYYVFLYHPCKVFSFSSLRAPTLSLSRHCEGLVFPPRGNLSFSVPNGFVIARSRRGRSNLSLHSLYTFGTRDCHVRTKNALPRNDVAGVEGHWDTEIAASPKMRAPRNDVGGCAGFWGSSRAPLFPPLVIARATVVARGNLREPTPILSQGVIARLVL